MAKRRGWRVGTLRYDAFGRHMLKTHLRISQVRFCMDWLIRTSF